MVYSKAKDFGKFLWEMCLDNIEQNIKFWKKLKDPPHRNFIEALSQIIPALDIFLDTTSQDSENDEFRIIIYESVNLETGKIIRISENFYRKK